MVRGYVTLGNFVQLAMLFLAMLLSKWVDVVLILLPKLKFAIDFVI